ncbi:MAG TPA: type ISP restriction/modification enzyme, partial [Terriglobales bacterium]|nr:type ISP restriction/modification enzyme [Terriglobales bacterium]
YLDAMGEYEPFPGICLVDTFELAEPKQSTLGFMNEENTARVQRQKQSPIFVIIGNPPYNAQQADEDDGNKNRHYIEIDRRIADTYARDSKATLRNSLSDPYVKAIRWASDRIGEEGIVALVTNNSFVHSISFDGMRLNLARDFSAIYVVNLGGNVRANPKLSGTVNNVFGIQVGVSINLFIRAKSKNRRCNLFYVSMDDYWRKEQKYNFLDEAVSASRVQFVELTPDRKNNWLTDDLSANYDFFLAAASKDDAEPALFEIISNGVKTNRDSWAYNFQPEIVSANIQRSIEFYEAERARWNRSRLKEQELDGFLKPADTEISWSAGLKSLLVRNAEIPFDPANIRKSRYRPFVNACLYFDKFLTERRLKFPRIFPTAKSEKENLVIAVTGHSQVPFSAQMVECIPCIDVGGRPGQCFPFYTYDEDGTNRRENITDWALEQFRAHYADRSITKWDIFHYVYAVLHHPVYRERYAANLKRELPRIPFAGSNAGPSTTPANSAGSGRDDDRVVFREFVKAGERLADLHVNYEKQPDAAENAGPSTAPRKERGSGRDDGALKWLENPQGKLSYRVEKMRLSKDKTCLIYNEYWTLTSIPAEVYEYRLGNRSALEWIVDQYQVSTDKRSGIVNDPNREDDAEYIKRLIGQVIYVSLETVKIVKALPEWAVAEMSAAQSA